MKVGFMSYKFVVDWLCFMYVFVVGCDIFEI